MEANQKRLEKIIRHIRLVQTACELLGNKLIELGEFDFGKMLIANGCIHDHSKFFGIEWEHLNGVETEAGKLSLKQHQSVNPHHPEYWGGIENMPRIYIAEMVCDWYARSTEFGSSLRDWIKGTALEKYSIPHTGKVYKQIKEFVDLLLEESWQK